MNALACLADEPRPAPVPRRDGERMQSLMDAAMGQFGAESRYPFLHDLCLACLYLEAGRWDAVVGLLLPKELKYRRETVYYQLLAKAFQALGREDDRLKALALALETGRANHAWQVTDHRTYSASLAAARSNLMVNLQPQGYLSGLVSISQLRDEGGKPCASERADRPGSGVAWMDDGWSVCHIGGAHTVQLRELTRSLQAQGVRQCVISYFPQSTSILDPAVPVYFFPYRQYWEPMWEQQQLETKLLMFLAQVFAKERVGMVHGHDIESACVPLWLAKHLLDLPCLIYPWSLEFLGQQPDSPAVRYAALGLSLVDRVAHPEQYVLDKVAANYGLGPERLHRGCGYPLYFDNFILPRTRQPEPTVLCARQMAGSNYAQEEIVRAMVEVRRQIPAVKLVLLIGPSEIQGQQTMARLKTLVASLGLADCTSFVERALSEEEFGRLMNRADVVMSLNSLDPGTAMTTIQAAIGGAITFVSDNGVPMEIKDGVNGFVTSHDPREIANKLLIALRNRDELRDRFWAVNRTRLQRFAAVETIRSLMAVYHTLAGR
jgi:glycosyltransferase involved in cell wall biosynthesis